jgi:hypothetical protein
MRLASRIRRCSRGSPRTALGMRGKPNFETLRGSLLCYSSQYL